MCLFWRIAFDKVGIENQHYLAKTLIKDKNNDKT